MNSVIQKKSHEVEIFGRLYCVEPGTMIFPDDWAGPTKVQESGWEKAEFYLPSYRYDDVVIPVNIRVTGRTLQSRPFSDFYWIRVQVEFVGDGNSSTFGKGWMRV